MKPNFRATATGSSSTSGFLEGDAVEAELDRVAGAQRLGAVDAAAVDLDAVGGAEVADDPGAAATGAPRRGGGRRSRRLTTTSQSRERPSTAPLEPRIDGAALVAQLRAAAARLSASASGSAMRLAVE